MKFMNYIVDILQVYTPPYQQNSQETITESSRSTNTLPNWKKITKPIWNISIALKVSLLLIAI